MQTWTIFISYYIKSDNTFYNTFFLVGNMYDYYNIYNNKIIIMTYHICKLIYIIIIQTNAFVIFDRSKN